MRGKGLESPVVELAGTGRDVTTPDLPASTLFHKKGLSVDSAIHKTYIVADPEG